MDIYSALEELNKSVSKIISKADKEFLNKIKEIQADVNVIKLYPTSDENINLKFAGKKIHLSFTHTRKINFKDSNGKVGTLILEKDIIIIDSKISEQPLFIQK